MAAKKKKVSKPVMEKVTAAPKPVVNAEVASYVSKNARYVAEIMKWRKTDIMEAFKIEGQIAALKHDASKVEQVKELTAALHKAYADAKVSRNEIKKIVKDAIAHKYYDLKTCFSYEQIKYSVYLDRLNVLRENGENKVIALRSEIRDILLNSQIDKETKKSLIATNRKQLEAAKKIAKKNHEEVARIVRQAMRASREDFANYFKIVKAEKATNIMEAKKFYRDMCNTLANNHEARLKKLREKTGVDKKEKAIDLRAENVAHASRINEAKVAYREASDTAKQYKYNVFMNKYGYTGKVKNDHHPIGEWLQFKYEHYIANFNLMNWLLKNALYVIIILVFAIIACLPAAREGDGLLSPGSILTALVQVAPKIFFALGVGGLILLGGTDLSIGRLTGVGVSFTLMILTAKVGGYPDNNQIVWFNLTGAAPAVKILLALFISILFCTLFTTFAGFFTAKFKMHPFISTLAVQLISYGLFQLFWSATSSFTPDENIIEGLRGPQSILLVVYAIIAILVVWFIWNKTRFGKHIYAVGGNQEAATVSGINPFTITLLAFVMAGILYGFGGFVQAVQTGTGNFNSGYGTETDAIAACVIGGISFSGGVGKVSGAVIGALILGFLTHAFGYIGVDSNLQLLIKGIIILVAVALDCVKYLRKK
ncbi:MAG: galactoside ABC transporter permease [Bacilli bacterium]|nr:galactoside ABC transporter permease [Bacilli bacterium]